MIIQHTKSETLVIPQGGVSSRELRNYLEENPKCRGWRLRGETGAEWAERRRKALLAEFDNRMGKNGKSFSLEFS
tara:strand:+ start:1955 stop:2179 length:225 start_codon:yes stop_codon:yes gene_type:complete